MRPVLSDGQLSFAGGINTVSDDISLQPNQIRLAQNARLNEYGAIVKRNGSVKAVTNALASPARNGFGWVRDSGAVQGLVVSGTNLYTADMLSLPVSSWTSVSSALSNTTTPTFTTFLDSVGADCVFIADGGKVMRWNGTTLVRETSPSAASVSYIKVHNQRLWGCGNSTYPDSIFYSPLNDGSAMGHSGGGQIIVRTFSDERVVALASVGSSLLIFHRRGISRLTGFGQDDTVVQPEGVSSQTGTIAPFSVVEVDGAAYFLSDRGAFIASESEVAQLGTPTTPDPLFPLIEGLSESQLANVRGVLSRRTQEIWWFIPGFGVYTYHLVLKAWSGPWTGEYLNTSCLFPSLVNNSAETFIIRGDSDGRVTVSDYPDCFSDGGTFAAKNSGTAVEMLVRLRRMYFDGETVSKAMRWGYMNAVLAGSTNMTVDWQTDVSSGTYLVQSVAGGTWDDTLTWSTSSVWGVVTSRNYRVPMSGTGYYTDVRLYNNKLNAPVISRWRMDAFLLGNR